MGLDFGTEKKAGRCEEGGEGVGDAVLEELAFFGVGLGDHFQESREGILIEGAAEKAGAVVIEEDGGVSFAAFGVAGGGRWAVPEDAFVAFGEFEAGTLAELEDGLRETAEPGKEGALVELEQFYAMTLRPDERAGVLATLEGKFPAKPEYGVELVRVLRGLDRDTEARVVLGGLVERAGEPVPVALVIEGALLDVW